MISEGAIQATISTLKHKHDQANIKDIEKSVKSLAPHWAETDDTEEDFLKFCESCYISAPKEKNALFNKLQNKLEKMFGLTFEMFWSNKWSLMMDTGPIQPIDNLLAEIDPFTHINEDLYRSKLAHLILLTFPLLTLEHKNKLTNTKEDRLILAQCRLAEMCRSRISAEVAASESSAINSSFDYINQLQIDLHRILTENNQPFSDSNVTVDIHWGLRDQINLLYRKPNSYHQQRLLYKIWKRATLEEIPLEFFKNKDCSWDPFGNFIYQSGSLVKNQDFHQGRYRALLGLFKAKKMEDTCFPNIPNYINRSFEFERELKEEKVKGLLIGFMTNPYISDCANYLKTILKRELCSFDIIFNQFNNIDQSTHEYDALVSEKYPTLSDFHDEIPCILNIFGFDEQLAKKICQQIQVASCRSGGFSSFPKMRGGKFILATTTDQNIMNYTSFLTAMHELGHCVEGFLSLETSDYYTLGKVPSSAFSEAFAYYFDSRSNEVLGVCDKQNQLYNYKILNLFWSCFLNCGLALVDIDIWHWMYKHPDCDESGLKAAVLAISKEIWNRYYFPILGEKNSTILAGYNVLVTNPLYMPEYALAIFIQTQIEHYLENKSLGVEMPRMCKTGNLTPDQWMVAAVGEHISSRALLEKISSFFKRI